MKRDGAIALRLLPSNPSLISHLKPVEDCDSASQRFRAGYVKYLKTVDDEKNRLKKRSVFDL